MKITRHIMISSILIVVLTLVMAASALAAPPVPSSGPALVDGNPSEWDLTGDFYANLTRDGDPTGKVEAMLYLRYDCTPGVVNGILYALVLPATGLPVVAQTGSASINLGVTSLVSDTVGDNGAPPDFAWINKTFDGALQLDVADGWEASTVIAKGVYQDFNVSTLVFDDGAPQLAAANNLEVDISEDCSVDYGDLPNDYGMTLKAQNGAGHVVAGVYLGPTIDSETNGQPGPMANGDDDENGVFRSGGSWDGGQGQLTIYQSSFPNVYGGNAKACLSGWLDFWGKLDNGVPGLGYNYSFSDTVGTASENIIINQPMVPGANIFNFPLPLNAAKGQSMYARFRVVIDKDNDGDCSDQLAPALYGKLHSGEVEDYFWTWSSTAVKVDAFKANSSTASAALLLMALGGVVSLTGLAWVWRKRQK